MVFLPVNSFGKEFSSIGLEVGLVEDVNADEVESTDWVIVEKPFVEDTRITGEKFKLTPYGERRSDWGSIIGLTYSLFEPINYQPNFSASDFSTVYESATTPLIEFYMLYKKNLSLYSIGFEVAIGTYASESLDQSTSLSLTPVRAGGRFSLDGLYETPWIVPYVSGGTYLMGFTETQASSTTEGNTSFALYVTGGLMIQMNWADPESARIGYDDSGIENTFLIFEARKFFASSEAIDQSFESEVHLNAGIHIEF